MTIRVAAMMVLGVTAMATTAPVIARGHHGFHGHRGGVHGGRMHCRIYKDQDGRRQRVCV